MRRLRHLLALEDVLWAGWLAVLRPASGGLFLEGGVVSAFLVAAAVGFWAAALSSERGGPRRSGAILLMSLGMCAIMIDAGLKQTGAALEVRQVHTGAVVLLGIAAAVQHRATVAPRRAIDPTEPAGTGTWALRYLWAIAAALLGERVVGPLLGGTAG